MLNILEIDYLQESIMSVKEGKEQKQRKFYVFGKFRYLKWAHGQTSAFNITENSSKTGFIQCLILVTSRF